MHRKPPKPLFGEGLADRLIHLTRAVLGIDRVLLARIVLRLAMVAIGIYLLMNSGCTALEKAPACANLDWYEIGRQDGVNGEAKEVFLSHKAACAGSKELPNEDLYLNGRNAGLVEFCTAQAGLEAGKAGRTYRKVCPEHLETAFLPAYDVGRRIHLLEIENADIEKRMSDIFSRLSSRGTRPSEQTTLQGRLEELRQRRAQNEIQINDIEDDFFERM